MASEPPSGGSARRLYPLSPGAVDRSAWGRSFPALRLIVARCEVVYSGRLDALLPDALRLIMVKADGSVLVHADAGGYKPLNWMTPPTVIEEAPERIVVRKRAAASEDRLEIFIREVLSAGRGIVCVQVDLAVLRGERAPELRLFAA